MLMDQSRKLFALVKDSEALSNASTGTNFITETKERKKRKMNIQRIRQITPNAKTGRWNEEEQDLFVEYCLLFGNNWKKVKFNFNFSYKK
jgi:hypothetical protein